MSAGDWKDMFLAACEGDVDLVRHHLDLGVDPNFSHPEFQSTALDVAQLLLDHGADPGLRSDLDDLTPIQAARQVGLADLEARLRAMRAISRPASVDRSA